MTTKLLIQNKTHFFTIILYSIPSSSDGRKLFVETLHRAKRQRDVRLGWQHISLALRLGT